MAVQFVLGKSGTGKTRLWLDQIVAQLRDDRATAPLILLVPEQATYQAEQSILKCQGIAGYSRLSVFSFARLQFMLEGKHNAREHITPNGRQMLIHALLRKNRSQLKAFASCADSPGLAERMAQAVIALCQSAHDDEKIQQLQKLAETQQTHAAFKLSDIIHIARLYQDTLGSRWQDTELELARTCSSIGKSDLIRGAKLWIDGFSGFTTAETAILTELLKYTDSAKIALCLDPATISPNCDKNALDPTSLFYPTELTYINLLEIVRKCGLKLEKNVILDRTLRFKDSPALAHIEKNIFSLDHLQTVSSGTVNIIKAANPRQEAKFAARKVLELIEQNHWLCSDIAVVASDLAQYEHYICAYFDEYKIPYFIDRKKSLRQHPISELLLSALSAAMDNFDTAHMMAFLKSDLGPLKNRDDVDTLENYCLAYGLDHDDWIDEQPWQFQNRNNSCNESNINNLRKLAAAAIIELNKKLNVAKRSSELTAKVFTAAVFEFFDQLNVTEKLDQLINTAKSAGDLETARSHHQVYEKFVEIFDEMCDAFADEPLTARDFFAILRQSLTQISLGMIPPQIEQVLVGSIERSRHPDLKAVLLLGCTQKSFPVPVSTAGLFGDDGLELAAQAGFEIAATSKHQLAQRQYLAYVAFTRPSQLLCVTYPSEDDQGKAQAPSSFVTNLSALFEDLHEESYTGENDFAQIRSLHELADILCAALGKDQQAQAYAHRDLCGKLLENKIFRDTFQKQARLAENAAAYDNSSALDKTLADEIFSTELKISASRLGTFAECPYHFFVQYILNLKKREEFRLDPLDTGTFYHAVLELLFKTLNQRELNISELSNEQLDILINELSEQVLTSDPFLSKFRSHSLHNAFIITQAHQTLTECVRDIQTMISAGNFYPYVTELSFGKDTETKLELVLQNGKKLNVTGKIDRIDIAEIDGKRVALIFDYKLSGKSFDWNGFFHGLNVQLPLYMLAASQLSGIDDVAGAFFFPIRLELKTADLEDTQEEVQTSGQPTSRKAKGLFNGNYWKSIDNTVTGRSKYYSFQVTKKDSQPYGSYRHTSALTPQHFASVFEHIRKLVVTLGTKMSDGDISIAPYSIGTDRACKWCHYKPLCRFDWQINKYSELEKYDKLTMLGSPEDENGV